MLSASSTLTGWSAVAVGRAPTGHEVERLLALAGRRAGSAPPVSLALTAQDEAFKELANIYQYKKCPGAAEAPAPDAAWAVYFLAGGKPRQVVKTAALVGLAGTNQVLGTVPSGVTLDLDAGIGFDAITVALLGRATPLGTVFAGLLFGALSVGGVAMQASAGTPKELAQVLQALIVLFVAAPMLVRGMTRLKAGGTGSTVMAKGWGG